jgi:hypothetical protein
VIGIGARCFDSAIFCYPTERADPKYLPAVGDKPGVGVDVRLPTEVNLTVAVHLRITPNIERLVNVIAAATEPDVSLVSASFAVGPKGTHHSTEFSFHGQ